MFMEKIGVAIVEDDREIRDWVTAVVRSSDDFRVVAVFPDAESCVTQFAKILPEIVIMDIQLPGMSGIDCVRTLKPQRHEVQFMMFTVFEEDNKVFESLRAGATGYILKNYPPDKIIEALHDLYKGGSPMSSIIARKIITTFNPSTEKDNEYNKLSKREKELLNLLSKGYRYKEIADQLSISIETVRTHIRNIYEKLHVQSRTEAINKIYK
jgi:DNA-binding NarL/FixJ family response regulator